MRVRGVQVSRRNRIEPHQAKLERVARRTQRERLVLRAVHRVGAQVARNHLHVTVDLGGADGAAKAVVVPELVEGQVQLRLHTRA